VKARISPSMMCAPLCSLMSVLDVFKQTGVDYLHIDVMDGVFVPNYALGTDFVRQLRKISDIPLDIHIMADRPEYKIGWFDPQPGEYVSVHVESTPHIQRAVAAIKKTGAMPMAAINPGTHYNALEYILDDIDAVLVMTVNPGYAGQALIERTIGKIKALRQWLDAAGYGNVEIEVDGNVSFVNAKRMREAGANIFVAGSSGVFAPGFGLHEAVNKFMESIQ